MFDPYSPYTTILETQEVPDQHRLAALDHAVHLADRGTFTVRSAADVVAMAEIFANFLDDVLDDDNTEDIG